MMDALNMQPSTDTKNHNENGNVFALLNFYIPPIDGSKPWNFVETQPEGKPQQNFGRSAHEVKIRDIRGHEKDFTLDEDAFSAITDISSSLDDFTDDQKIRDIYYPEVETLLRQATGCTKVTIFDHTVRRSDANAHRKPVSYVHVDQTPRSAMLRVKLHDSEEADDLMQQRYRIINVWRPINGVVESNPLCFASARTVETSDIVGVEHRYPDRLGESAAVRYNVQQQFFYWSKMDNHDRVLLKCFDSKDGVGQCVPHTAFEDPRSRLGAKPRHSIEVRALVYD